MGVYFKALCVNTCFKTKLDIDEEMSKKYKIHIVNSYINCQYLKSVNSYDLVVIYSDTLDDEILELTRIIKSKTDIAIILYTSKYVLSNDHKAFDNTIDDYILKGCTEEEMCFRMLFNINKNKDNSYNEFFLDDKKINLNDGIIEYKDDICKLTSREVTIVRKLYENKNHVVSMDDLSYEIWNSDAYGYENAIMVHIGRIRKKIENDPEKPKYITTIKGMGYSLSVN